MVSLTSIRVTFFNWLNSSLNLSVASDPENLGAINILAGMGILTDDDGLVDAALSEVMALPIDQRHKLDSKRDVDYLLIQHGLSQVCISVLSLILIIHCSFIIRAIQNKLCLSLSMPYPQNLLALNSAAD